MTAFNFEQARFNMIEQQIRPWEVLDQRVLDTLASMPREDFVPERYRNLAFSDVAIPLGHGEVMLKPPSRAASCRRWRRGRSIRCWKSAPAALI